MEAQHLPSNVWIFFLEKREKGRGREEWEGRKREGIAWREGIKEFEWVRVKERSLWVKQVIERKEWRKILTGSRERGKWVNRLNKSAGWIIERVTVWVSGESKWLERLCDGNVVEGSELESECVWNEQVSGLIDCVNWVRHWVSEWRNWARE
jgi:hypothetical protein